MDAVTTIRASGAALAVADFKALFEAAPGLHLVLAPDPAFTIVAASNAYLTATMTSRGGIVGRGIFDVFPDNSDEPTSTGVHNLRASLNRVRDTARTDTMAVQKIDIRRPASEGGGFEERYWSPVNSPVLLGTPPTLAYIIHRVEDVTEFVSLRMHGLEQSRLTEALQSRAEEMEAENYRRAHELQDANRLLRAANEELQQSGERLRNLMDSAPDALVVTDDSGRITLVNVMTETLFGYSRDELLGRPVEMLLPDRYRESHPIHRRSYLEAPRPRPMGANIELCARRRDGSEFPVELSLSPATTLAGIQVASTIRDTSAHKQTLAQLREARNEADRANRAKGAFLATASHDLRQPLQALAMLNAVLMRRAHDKGVREALRQQEAAIDSMARLMNALLDISKLESGVIKPQSTDWPLASLLAEIRAEFASFASAKGLQLLVAQSPIWVTSDLSLVGQVLRNLVQNAIKYTRVGEIRISCTVAADTARVEVSDTGIGIAQADLAHIYDEFYQVGVAANAARDGYGLGLSIVSRIVKLLGLTLEVRSEPGAGSTFTLSLPVARQVTAERPAAQSAAAEPQQREAAFRHILIVDDHTAVRDAMRMLLKVEGFRVTTASTPDEAAAKTRDNSDIALVITDYHLSGSATGQQVIQAVRAVRGPAFPVLLITGDTSAAVRDLASERDLPMLSKPVNPVDLVRRLQQLLPC